MLNSCWRVWVGGGSVGMEGDRTGEVETLHWATTLSHCWSSWLIHDRCLVFSLPSPFPSLVPPFISQCSPLWLFSFYSHPCPPPSLYVSEFHSPSAAQGLFSFQMRARKSCDKVHFCLCVCMCWGLSVVQVGSCFIFYSSLHKPCFDRNSSTMIYTVGFLNEYEKHVTQHCTCHWSITSSVLFVAIQMTCWLVPRMTLSLQPRQPQIT